MRIVLFYLLSITSTISFAQIPVIYDLTWYEQYETRKAIRFVSLSDKYMLNSHEDSLAIPPNRLGSETVAPDDYIRLTGDYRQRCLTQMKISANDIVYIYDYSNDKLLRFYVSGLNLIAVINPYSVGSKSAISQNEYMIGFEINPAYLSNKHERYLVAIGKTSPFTRGKVKSIEWKKVDASKFPLNGEFNAEIQAKENDEVKADTYQYHLNGMDYFVQTFGETSYEWVRYVIVINSTTKSIVFEHVYHGSEGGNPSALNFIDPIEGNYLNQFTGQLFKNMPPVIFGFMNFSFGCPHIDFLADDMESVYINCDNRH